MTIASWGLEKRNKIIRYSLTPIDLVYVLAIMPNFGRKSSGKVRYGFVPSGVFEITSGGWQVRPKFTVPF